MKYNKTRNKIRASFQWLRSCVNYAAYHVDKGMWNKVVMTAYLRTCAVSARVQENVWSVIKTGSDNLSPIVENDIVDEYEHEIDGGYAPITSSDGAYIPKNTECKLNTNSYVNCGMHLIF